MKERIVHLDAIKGLAIILVVVGHVIAWNYPDWEQVCLFKPIQPVNYMVGGVVWQIIYSFHMALFFMVSGYLSGALTVNRDNIISRLKSRTQRLLIPYLTTGYLIYFIRGSWGYWFLLTLYEISLLALVLMFVLQKFNNKNKLWFDFLLFVVVYFLLRTIPYIPVLSQIVDHGIIKYFIPFCFGILMRRHKQLESLISETSCFTICLILFVLMFTTRYLTDYPGIYAFVSKIDFFFSVLAIFACIIVFHIFIKGIKRSIQSFFAYIGTLSMPIYILHNLFVLQIDNVGSFLLSQKAITSITLQLIYSSVVAAIAICLCILLYKVLSYSIFIRKLFFGE